MTPVGLPHSEISGSKRACRSPKHIAACHVLHRLSVPRHPPSTLSNLTIKCLDLMRSAALNLCGFIVHSLSTTRIQLSTNASIAKIDAEGNLMIAITVDSREHSRSCGLVELIGIEPTTLCLQSRCSPS